MINPPYFNLRRFSKRTIVIGDIHGCYDEMLTLLITLNFNENDVLISVGDLVDRGPKSWEVASFFKNTKNAYCTLGNHERRISGVIKGTSQTAWSQVHSLSQIPSEEHSEWSVWFDSLPAVIENEHAIITHARLDPAKSIIDQDPYFTSAVGGDRVIIERDEKDVPLWYYQICMNNKINKPICFGHVAYKEVELVSGKLFALDTKAVQEGELTAIIFPECKTITAKVKQNYYDKSYSEYCEKKYSTINIVMRKFDEIKNIIKILPKSNAEENLISLFIKEFEKHKFLERAEILNSHLQSKYGRVPNEGKERGEYFIQFERNIEDRNQRRLIKKILVKEFIDINTIFLLYPDLSINTLELLFGKLENELSVVKK